MTDDWFGRRTSEVPTDPARFATWLDAALGRPLVIVVVRHAGASATAGDAEPGGDALAGWRAQLGAYPGVRLVERAIGDAPEAPALASIAQLDPDVLLVREPARDRDAKDTPGNWRTAMLGAAEDLNLFDRMLIAWLGVGVTRARARAAGFEDGFSLDQPFANVLAVLAREAVAREPYRRRGSSPPCYLGDL